MERTSNSLNIMLSSTTTAFNCDLNDKHIIGFTYCMQTEHYEFCKNGYHGRAAIFNVF